MRVKDLIHSLTKVGEPDSFVLVETSKSKKVRFVRVIEKTKPGIITIKLSEEFIP